MLNTSCHCGSVQIQIPRKPRSLTNCNCSICRRYGVLWAYYKATEVKMLAGADATESYAWGDKQLRFVRCKNCGCVMKWEDNQDTPSTNPKARVGVNARNFDPDQLGAVKIRLLDGAVSWKYLD